MDINTGLKAIAAGIAILSTFGSGLGMGLIVFGATTAMARNPAIKEFIQTAMILGIVFTETISIYALVVALLLIFT